MRVASEKQQFNVTLPPALIRAVKHRSIDESLSLSDWLERVLMSHLSGEPSKMIVPQISLQPMVHVTDMPSAIQFYEILGASLLNGSRDGDFVLLNVGGANLQILAHPANPEQGEGDVELSFAASDLDAVKTRLQGAGADIVSGPTDEGFGRQLQVRAPGGMLVKINELDPSLYG